MSLNLSNSFLYDALDGAAQSWREVRHFYEQVRLDINKSVTVGLTQEEQIEVAKLNLPPGLVTLKELDTLGQTLQYAVGSLEVLKNAAVDSMLLHTSNTVTKPVYEIAPLIAAVEKFQKVNIATYKQVSGFKSDQIAITYGIKTSLTDTAAANIIRVELLLTQLKATQKQYEAIKLHKNNKTSYLTKNRPPYVVVDAVMSGVPRSGVSGVATPTPVGNLLEISSGNYARNGTPQNTVFHELGHILLQNLNNFSPAEVTDIKKMLSTPENLKQVETIWRRLKRIGKYEKLDTEQEEDLAYHKNPDEIWAREVANLGLFNTGKTKGGKLALKYAQETGLITKEDLRWLHKVGKVAAQDYDEGVKSLRKLSREMGIDVYTPDIAEASGLEWGLGYERMYGGGDLSIKSSLLRSGKGKKPMISPEDMDSLLRQALGEEFAAMPAERISKIADGVLSGGILQQKKIYFGKSNISSDTLMRRVGELMRERSVNNAGNAAPVPLDKAIVPYIGGDNRLAKIPPLVTPLPTSSVYPTLPVGGGVKYDAEVRARNYMHRGEEGYPTPNGLPPTKLPTTAAEAEKAITGLTGALNELGKQAKISSDGIISLSGKGKGKKGSGEEDWIPRGFTGEASRLNALQGTAYTRTDPITGQPVSKYAGAFARAQQTFGSFKGENGENLISAKVTNDKNKIEFAYKNAQSGFVDRLVLFLDDLGQAFTKEEISSANAKGRLEAKMKEKQMVMEEKSQNSLSFIQQNYPTAYAYLQKKAPTLVENQSSKWTTDTATTTGVTRIRGTLKDADTGAIEHVNVAVDRFGKVLVDTSRRFADFGTALKNNISQFFRWSLAVSLVYAPLQKLQQLSAEVVKEQELLIHTVITLGQTQSGTNAVLESAYKVAQKTGESLTGVIEGYNQVLRATGNIPNTVEKAATAEKLLADSITLAKISGMSQASATDALVASLKQMNMPLTDGTVLLDKWVKTSRIANVDVNTLSTSFSIVAEAATNAGLSVDELNGLIATVSEVTTLTARETGNSVRALISGYTSDNARKELSRFGISVKDAEGNARGFSEVMMNIKDLFDAKLISDDQLNRIGLAIGGGNRRQAQTVATLVNLDRMNEVAAQSALANGEAQKALELEMGTVATAAEKLNNAFLKLGMSLGMEGGLLAGVTSLLDGKIGITALLGIVNQLVASLGAAGPVLLATGVAMKTLGTNKLTAELKGFMGMFGGLASASKVLVSEIPWAAKKTGMATQYEEGNLGLQGKISDQTTLKIGSGIAAGFMGAMEAAKGNVGGGMAIAFAGILGSVLDPVLGLMAATLVSAIVQAFDKGKARMESEGFSAGFAPRSPASRAGTSNEQPGDAALKKLYELAGGETSTAFQAGIKGGKTIPDIVMDSALIKATSGNSQASAMGVSQALLESDPEKYLQLSKDFVANNPEAKKAMESQIKNAWQAMIALEEATGVTVPGKENRPEFAPYLASQKKAQEEKAAPYVDTKLIAEIAQEQKQYLSKELYSKGTISAKTYREGVLQTQSFNASLPQYVAALSNNYADLGDNITNAEEAQKMFADLIIKGTPEQKDEIDGLKGRIEMLTAAEERANKLGTRGIDFGGKSYTRDQFATMKQQADAELRQGIATVNRDITIAKTPVPTFMKTQLQPSAWEDLLKAMPEQKEKAMAGLTSAEQTSMENMLSNTTFYVEFSDGTHQKMEGYTQEMVNNAIQNTEELKKKLEETVGFSMNKDMKASTIDKTLSQYQQLKPLIEAQRKQQIEAAGQKYEPLKETWQTMYLADGQMRTFSAAMEIFQALLTENNDLNRKQIEGIYNLPSGMAFWLPSSSLDYKPDTGTMGAEPGPGGVTTPKLTPVVERPGEGGGDGIEVPGNGMTLWQEGWKTAPTPVDWTQFDSYKEPASQQIQPTSPSVEPSQYPEDSWVKTWYMNQATAAEGFKSPWPSKPTEEKTWGEQTGWERFLGLFEQKQGEQYKTSEQAMSGLDAWSGIFNNIKTIFGALTSPVGGGGGGGLGGVPNAKPIGIGAGAAGGTTATMPKVQTSLQLTIDNKQQLFIDGRQLANILKTYIIQDLIRYDNSTGAARKSF